MTNSAVREGKLSVPEHLRGKTVFEHGTKLQILEYPANGDPQRVKVLIRGKELTLEKRYVTQT